LAGGLSSPPEVDDEKEDWKKAAEEVCGW